MAKLQKSVQKRNLAQVQTWITDSNPFSDYFRLAQLPDVFPGGKSGFLINGSPNLVQTTQILMELLDVNGNTVFIQPVKNYQEGLARVISAEVYENTPPGPATLTIVGEVAFDTSGALPPKQWVGTYNVKWQKTINIESTKPNSNIIRLYNQPVITVNEQLVPFLTEITGSIINISSGSITGQYIAQNTTVDPISLTKIVTPASTQITSDNPIFNDSTKLGILTANISVTSEAPIRGATPQTIIVPFTSSFNDVFSSFTAQLNNVVTASANTPVQIWNTSNYTMSYQTPSTFVTTSIVQSFANIQLSDLTTFTGNAYRAKFYLQGKQNGQTPPPWELIQDVILDSQNFLLTESFQGQVISVGNTVDQQTIDNFWESGIIVNGLSYLVTGSVASSYNASELLDSVNLTGSVPAIVTGSSFSAPQIWTGIDFDIPLADGPEYTFQANFICIKDNDAYDANIDVRLFGPVLSAAPSAELGYSIMTLNVPIGQSRKIFRNQSINFTLPSSDIAKIRFVINGGNWYISNVQLLAVGDNGFNPDVFTLRSQVVGHRFDNLKFKAELYDVNNNLVPVDIETGPIYFDGGNMVIRGSDNRMDGRLTIASSGSGPTLSTEGYFNTSGTFMTGGQALFIGPGIPQVFTKDTAFFAGTSSLGPEISVGDRLHGYIDPSTGQFVLNIIGTILIGSGSDAVNLLNLFPTIQKDTIFARLSASIVDAEDVRGRNSVTAGRYDDQIARMGYYTRNRVPPVWAPTSSMPQISSSYDAGNILSQRYITSASISIPSSMSINNNVVYIDADLFLNEFDFVLPYILTYEAGTFAAWSGTSVDTSGLGDILAGETNIFVLAGGLVRQYHTFTFPVTVPQNRTGDILTVYLYIQLHSAISK